MDENEMDLDAPTTRRDLKELEGATRRDLKELEGATRRDLKELRSELSELETRLSELIRGGFANHPTHAESDASFRQVQLHIEAVLAQHPTHAELAQHTNAIVEASRADRSTQHAQQTRAIHEDMQSQISGLDDRYRDLPERVAKLEIAVFSTSRPPKRKPG
jgi:chromosome segregation ATPase